MTNLRHCPNNQHHRNAARKTTKKVQIVTPLDEWPRPPTFVGGGIRWTRANKPKGPSWNSMCNYFEITWSMAYKKVRGIVAFCEFAQASLTCF